MDLGTIADLIRGELDDKTAARDQALVGSRHAIRLCGNAIRALHRHDLDATRGLLADARGHLDEGRGLLAGHPDMLHAGFVHDAEKEYAEAHITLALIEGRDLPGPEDLGISSSAYLKGMAESIGEIRRHILDQMRAGDLGTCERLLAAMDDMYYVLVSMDYPDGITYGLRRLTDVARSIIERTRGDFSVATVQSSLRRALEVRMEMLEEE